LFHPAIVIKPFSQYNTEEFIYAIPGVSRFYITGGNKVILEPISNNWKEIQFYFLTGVLAAILYQRNILPFHVSGIILPNQTALLFAGHQRAGKSTTSIMLQEKGYEPFTDDTAVLQVENGRCYGLSSYPVIRAMESTLKQQKLYPSEKIHPILKEGHKFNVHFHENFVSAKIPVSGIIFLGVDGDEIEIESLKATAAIKYLNQNLYRYQWIPGMKKEKLVHDTLTNIAGANLSFWKAVRPKIRTSYQSFADAIELKIISTIVQ